MSDEMKLCLKCKHVEMGNHLRELYVSTNIAPAGMNLRCGRTKDVLVGDSVKCADERAGTSGPRYPQGAPCGSQGTYWIAADD